MNLNFNIDLARGYKSNSQIARILTENWVKENSYCPCCGENPLNEFENNRPVADFYCKKCNEEFELKLCLCRKYENVEISRERKPQV